jgi:von Willebrand factor type A domain
MHGARRPRTWARFLRGVVMLPVLSACTAPQLAKVEDSKPPTVRIVAPADGARILTATPAIDIEYSDEGAGVAAASFRATINDADYSTAFDHYSRGATGRVPASRPLRLGKNRLVVEVPDRAGNLGRAEITFWNGGAGWLTVGIPPGSEPRRSVELVLDASGSMRDKVGERIRMAVAKDAVKGLVEALPGTIPLGLRVYWDCTDIKSILPIQSVDKPAFVAEVEKIEPKGGTPLIASLLQSIDALSRIQEGERLAVLVTDGGESCGGGIEQAVGRAKEAGVRVVVIGVDIPNRQVEAQLRMLGEGTGGALLAVDASAAGKLLKALEQSVLRIGYQVLDASGRQAAQGDVNGERVELPLGTYEVRLALVPPITVQGVVIGSLSETNVQLHRSAGALSGRVLGPVPVPGMN